MKMKDAEFSGYFGHGFYFLTLGKSPRSYGDASITTDLPFFKYRLWVAKRMLIRKENLKNIYETK